MISEEFVDLSRLQFALTALYHFLFVPGECGAAGGIGFCGSVELLPSVSGAG